MKATTFNDLAIVEIFLGIHSHSEYCKVSYNEALNKIKNVVSFSPKQPVIYTGQMNFKEVIKQHVKRETQ
jgi:hypothetical protein